MTTRAPLVKHTIPAADIAPGDRMDCRGKIRFVARAVRPNGSITWRIQTNGARSANISGPYQPEQTVTVFRRATSAQSPVQRSTPA